jgi:hypothetical protein
VSQGLVELEPKHPRLIEEPICLFDPLFRFASAFLLADRSTPTVAPGEVNPVPAGTIMDYTEYQQSINQAAETGGINSALNGGSNGAGSLKVDLGLGMGLTVLGGVVVGVVGLF